MTKEGRTPLVKEPYPAGALDSFWQAIRVVGAKIRPFPNDSGTQKDSFLERRPHPAHILRRQLAHLERTHRLGDNAKSSDNQLSYTVAASEHDGDEREVLNGENFARNWIVT